MRDILEDMHVQSGNKLTVSIWEREFWTLKCCFTFKPHFDHDVGCFWKVSKIKVVPFKSRKFLHKFQLNWCNRTQVMDCLVDETLFWLDFIRAIISCEFLKILKMWSKWKLYRTCWSSYRYKFHEFWLSG